MHQTLTRGSTVATRGPTVATILVVGFDAVTRAAISGQLGREGFRLLVARDEDEAVERVMSDGPGLALIDLDTTRADGMRICKALRACSLVPIILMSTQDCEADAVAGLDAGADDYMCQPHRLRELVARIRAALRRSPLAWRTDDREIVRVGDLVLDSSRHEVHLRGQKIELPLREFEVLEVLVSSPGRVWTRQALMLRVWGETPASGTKSLDVHIRRIRARIEDDPADPSRILTVRGVGYRYASEAAAAAAPAPFTAGSP